ncbi:MULTISPECIES: DUF11 domain-containing protein [unclassified Photobacterium]|uniref:DUF11 domain-containing protein n=1 Tax=unclassified Photobacterium TaxID=2628852 RepID=UPI001EDC9E98|nr:DUF11 domain-containing protein [Photobacterium sp. Ph6]MCG3874582.1 DUF11 domain-containing protein [Photobacterium sp. Ph5]
MLPAQANITDDLVVTISAPKNYDAGSSVKYTLTIKNNSEVTTYKNIKLNASIADITTMLDSGEEGNAFSSVSNKVDTIGDNSDAGVFNTSGNLASTNIIVAPSESITYIITAKTVENAIGDINTSDHVSFKKGFWFKKELDAVVTQYLQPDLSITKTVANTAYQTGKKITYTVVVENAAHAGTARHYHVIDTLSSIQSQAANNNIDDNNNWSHTDEDKSNPFTTWDIAVAVENGADSSLSSPLKDTDLDDTVTLPAKGKITYTVTATTTTVAIAEISNKALLLDAKKQQIAETALVNTNTQLVNTTQNTKRVIESEYSPGNEITYKLRVKNTDKHKFANNISLLDKLMTCPTTTQSTGADEAPFEYWYIDSIDAENTAKGTDAGVAANNPSAHRTDNINFVVDLAPNSYIEYTIKAKVKDTTIGHIQDSNACGDDFDESGSGIDMPKGKIQIKKSVDQDKFTPGEDITYTIEVKNPSNGLLLDIPVVDKLNEITAENADGKMVYPFVEGSIRVTTDQGKHSNPDVNGDLNKNPIDVKATIFPNESVKYIVTAKTKQDIVGVISNTAYAGEGTQQGKSTVITTPRLENLNIEKHVKGANSDGWRAYGYKDDEFTYTIKVTNPAPAGFAQNVTVTDAISQIKAELLEKAGEEVPVFTSWTVSTATDGGAEVVTAPENNKDLESVINVPADSSVTFTVTANIDPRRKDHVIWGKFTNQAQAKLARTGEVIKTANVDVVPAEPRLRLRKLVSNSVYTVGQPLEYTIDIQNYDRDGYVNDGRVSDSISSLSIFDQWKVWWEVIDDEKNPATTDRGQGTELFGYPTTEASASESTKDINNARFDLAPHQTLRIHVKGLVSEKAVGKGKITNVVTATDNAGDHFDASVDVNEDNTSVNSISIYKYGDPDFKRYHPGDKYTWTVRVVNNSANAVDNVVVNDKIIGIDVLLANNGDNKYADITGTPYRSWTITKQVGEGSEEHFSDDVDLHNELKLAKKGEAGDNATYRITAIIKDNVVDEWLNNVADVTYLTLRNGKMEPITAYAKASVQRASTGGDVTRHLNETQYIPGKTKIVYTITASSNLGYMNNKAILENLEGLTVKTINKDGTTSEGNPFDHGSGPEFTVSVEKSEVTGHDVPSTSTDGTLDGTVADNKNIDTTIDVAPKDKVIYTVTGTVRDDAVGDITFNNDPDLVVEPYESKLEIEKKVDQKSYEPGKPLHYTLTVKNTGKAHAFDVHVKDLLADVKVLDVNGNQAPAFSSVTTTDKYSGEYKTWYFAGHYDKTGSINTTDTIIPLGGTAVYSVNAVVNKDAVGPITNALDVNGNTTEVVTNPVTAKYIANKTIVAYYDDEKNKLPDLKGYMPGGYIEYQVTVTNQSTANIDDLSIKDDLSTITAKTVDGGEEPVFDDVLIDYAFVRQDAFSKVAGFASSTQVLDTKVDIGPENAVTFNIKAHIKPTIVGTFQNEANIGDRLHPKSPISKMLPANVELTKIVMDSAGKEIKTYQPGQKIQYKIELSNKGYGTSYTVALKDELSKLLTNVAELSGDGKQDPTATPFSHWIVHEPVFDGGITTIPLTTGQNDIKAKAVLAPKVGKITILVDATISDDALGDITNTAVFGKKSDDAVLTPEPKDIRASKNVIELDGKPFTSNSYYLPGQKATYEIKVKNSSNNWANDITVKDVVSHVNVDVAGDKNEPAYSNYRITYRVEGGVSCLPDTFVPVNTPLDNKQLDTELDIAPQQTVYFTVEAMIKDTAVGVIEPNHAFVNDLDNTSQEIPPQNSDFVIHKKVADEDKTFTPGQEINYTITVENTGDAWLNDLPIKDELTAITADIAHDATSSTTGSAFSSVSVEAKATDGSFVTSNASDNIDAVADIKPKGSVTFTVTAVVADNVIGEIDNTAYAGSDNTPSEKVTITPKQGDFELTKTADTETYVTGQEVTYSVTLSNSSDAWISDISLQDQVSKIVADSHAGVKAPAFDASSINFTWASEGAIKSFVDVNSVNESATVSLAPKGKVIFTIKAKVADNIVGDITNEAIANDKTADVTITPKVSEFDIHKAADIETFVPGQVVTYTVTVNNTGGTWLDDLPIKDDLKAIQTDVIGTSGSKEKGNAFSAIEVTASATPDSTVTNTAADTIDATADIKPQGSVTFTVKATVAANVIGNIDNTAYAGNDNTPSETVTITPESGDFTLTKTADIAEFVTGQEVTYVVTLENSSDSWITDIQLSDKVSKIMALSHDGNDENAFESSSISYEWHVKGTDKSYIESDLANESAVVNLAPKGIVDLTIKAKVAENVVGDITNVATANDKTAEVTIDPKRGDFTITKSVNKATFVPGKPVTYTVTVKNTGGTWLDNFPIKDDLKAIEADIAHSASSPVKGVAFNTVSVVAKASDGSSVTNSVTDNIDAIADIKPDGDVTFTVEATVADNVIGAIDNTAYAGEENTPSETVTITPEQGDFALTKSADTDTFIQGQKITYTVTLSNDSDSWVTDVLLKDEVSKIEALDPTGTKVAAFDPATIKVSATSEGSLDSFVDINTASESATVSLAPHGKVHFDIEANVASNIVGDITNVAMAGNKSAEATITPTQGEFTLEKAVNKPTFVPNDTMTYSLTLKNNSEAWVTNVKVTDAFNTITTELAGHRTGLAFDKSSIKVTSGKITAGEGYVKPNPDGSASALVDLAPNSEAVITVDAQVASDVVGNIANTAYANDQASNEVVITPEASEITIEKTADISEFVPGQTVNYTVTVNNTKASWATGVNIKDEVSKIEAEIAGGTPTSPLTGSAFDANSIVTKIVDLGDSKVVKQESNESIILDIAPNASVVVNIAANVNKNVIGSITNIAHAIDNNGDDHNAEVTIEPIEGAVILTKEAIYATYKNGGEVGFDIKVENTGAGFAANVTLEDLISKIEATTNLGQPTPALTHWKVSYVAGDENTKVMDVALNKLKQNLPEDKDVNVVMDIAPQDTVTFTVMGTAADDIVDDITNTASMTFGENKQDATATVKPEQTNFEATKASVESYYTINKDVSFELSITNTSNNIINDMVVNDDMSGIKVKYRDGSIGPAFVKDSTKFVVETVPQGAQVQAQTESQFLVDLLPKQTITFKVTGKVVDSANGMIQNVAQVNDQDVPSNFVPPLEPEITGTIVTTTDYDDDNVGEDENIYVPGGTVVYTITLENNTDAFANNVGFMSEFSKVSSEDYNGRQIHAYTDWKIATKATGTERGTTVGSYTDGKDVQTGLHIAPHSKVVYTFTTQVDKNLVNVIDYAAFYIDRKVIGHIDVHNLSVTKLESEVKPMLPEYDLKLTKTASKATAQVGDVVEYEVMVENDNKANFYDVSVVDHYPAGFQYVTGSTQIVHSGPDGEFDTKDDQSLSQEPVMSGQLTFRKVNLKSNEKVRVRYLMRVSTGVTFGKYVNTAVAQIRGEDKSNVDKAVVEIEADKLFDTASIIGKVFEDLNGDGFQADATAKGITVKIDLPKGDYVANSTTLMRDGKTTVVSDAKQAAPINRGITVKTLMGQSQNRTLKQSNKAVIRFKTTTATPFAFSVTTSNGTHVHFGTDSKITRTLTGDTKQGLSAENLNVTRNLYQAKTGYVWEIVIENLGIYEDGIPGVRLITTEGIKIETDQFGRYHIPDQWVKDKKGKNFLVKVDTDSLPTGMKVISENPKVQRITPNALAKFNFSVQTKH